MSQALFACRFSSGAGLRASRLLGSQRDSALGTEVDRLICEVACCERGPLGDAVAPWPGHCDEEQRS